MISAGRARVSLKFVFAMFCRVWFAGLEAGIGVIQQRNRTSNQSQLNAIVEENILTTGIHYEEGSPMAAMPKKIRAAAQVARGE